MTANDFSDIKKKRTLSLVFETGLTPKAFFLGDTRYGKWLAREACAKDIKLFRYINLGAFFCYIAKRHFSEIGQICFLGKFIPFRGKYTFTAMGLHS